MRSKRRNFGPLGSHPKGSFTGRSEPVSGTEGERVMLRYRSLSAFSSSISMGGGRACNASATADAGLSNGVLE